MRIWKRGFLLLLALLLGLPAAFSEDFEKVQKLDIAGVKDRFYQNPLPVIDIGDPFLLQADDTFHLFATGGTVGFNVWRSSGLQTYEKQKALQKVSWASGDYWAPEVFAYGGRYVMLFTARRREDRSLRIGIAFSDHPEGPYEDLGQPLFDLGYAAIDATLFVEGEVPYLIYVRDCSENVVGDRHESHIYGVRLSADLLSMEGEPVLLTAPDQEWELESEGDYLWNEGPAVVPHDGQYYLYYSAHHFADKRYGVGVAVADHPLGPYVKQENNPLLWYVENEEKVIVSGPGHNSFFSVGGELFTAYHTHTYPLAPSGNRQLNIDRAGFHADGTAFINGPTRSLELLPFSMAGLINHAPDAKGDGIAALIDGDACAAPASSEYVWRGTACALEWDTPRASDMIVLNLLEGSAEGRMILNGRYAVDIEPDDATDGTVILHFAPMEIESLRVEWNAEVSVGELYVVGEASKE